MINSYISDSSAKKKEVEKIVTIECIFPDRDPIKKTIENKVMIYLKGNHHLVINITVKTN